MAAMDSIASKFAEYEYLLKLLTAKLEETAAECERLKANSSAHEVLQSIYRNPETAEGNRIKAATAAINFEQPKIGSVLPSIGSINRTERWRVFERWSQRRQYIIEHHELPPAGWDDHLKRDNYVEPPESEGMPPVDVLDTPQGFKVLTNLLPKPGQRRIIGNGGSDD
jgi:hypothetical protein